MSEFYHDSAGVRDNVSNMKLLVDSYKETLESLESLIGEITVSNDWKDLTLKTSYLNDLNSYMLVYQGLYEEMLKMVSKLEYKSSSLDALESMYS